MLRELLALSDAIAVRTGNGSYEITVSSKTFFELAQDEVPARFWNEGYVYPMNRIKYQARSGTILIKEDNSYEA